MVANVFTWTLCLALFLGVSGFTIKKGNTHGQNQGGSSQSAVGYDASKSVQQNPASADQKFVRYGTVLSPLNAKQVGSVASDQMDYKHSNANNNPAGSQQQGLGANAQALSWGGSNTGAFPHHSGAMYGGVPSYGPHVSRVGPGFGHHSTNFKGGELVTEDANVNYGNYKSETEEQGTMPQPPPATFSASGYSSQPRLEFGGYLPYYYDYRFLTGQYPPGTYTHASISHSHGLNNWNDAHYVREYVPYAPRPQVLPQTSSDASVPMKFDSTKKWNPVVYQGSATRQQVPRQDSGHQGWYRVRMPSQFGSMGKV